ncbi:MAG TPA: PEGA domain-containing protein [Polyangia bacterium]|nr:PEGA domain-containing protein [Polyangia bacterium]
MTTVRRLSRAFHAALLGLTLLLPALGGCAHTLDAGAAGIRVECDLPDATVWIDDLLAGSAKEWKSEGHQIRAGYHRIEIRHPGYYSFFQEVDLPPGSQTVVNAKLREVLD